MSDNQAEKRHGFERWVASLRVPVTPAKPAPRIIEEGDLVPSLDEQATLIQRLPKEVIQKLREREANREANREAGSGVSNGLPQNDDCTAVFTPPPELLVRAKRLDAPPKPSRLSSPDDPKSEADSAIEARVSQAEAQAWEIAQVLERAHAERSYQLESRDRARSRSRNGSKWLALALTVLLCAWFVLLSQWK